MYSSSKLFRNDFVLLSFVFFIKRQKGVARSPLIPDLAKDTCLHGSSTVLPKHAQCLFMEDVMETATDFPVTMIVRIPVMVSTVFTVFRFANIPLHLMKEVRFLIITQAYCTGLCTCTCISPTKKIFSFWS